MIAVGTLLATGCSDSPSIKKVIDLQTEEKQIVITMSKNFNSLLKQKATINFIKTCMKQADKASFMMDYLSLHFNDEQKEMARNIVEHLFENNQKLSAKTSEDNFLPYHLLLLSLSKNCLVI